MEQTVALPFNEETLAAFDRVPTSPPMLGEVWGLGRDGNVHALALVTSNFGGFYLAVPVIPSSGWATEDELVLPDDVLGVEGTVVLHAETGVQEHLFQRRIAPVLFGDELAELRTAMQSEDNTLPTPLPRGANDRDGNSAEWLVSVLENFRALCFDG